MIGGADPLVGEVRVLSGAPALRAPRRRGGPRAIALACCAGTTIEYYDFFIYGTAAALVFGRVFFPGLGTAAATGAAFATFGVAFLFRPLGSVLFGHLGDRLGRTTTLIITLLLMGVSTTTIGLLPGPASIGAAAPLLLVALRAMQGLAVGGEWAGAAVLAAEYAPAGQRGRYGMFPQLGPPIAFGLASATFLVTALTMSPARFVAWGWRVPFLLSVLLVAIGLYIRLRVAETPVFRQARSRGDLVRAPAIEALRCQWREILLIAGAMSVLFGVFFIGSVYLTSYAGPASPAAVRGGVLRLSRPEVLACGVVAAGILAGATAASAWASDRHGRRPQILLGGGAAIVWGPLAFVVMQPGSVLRFGVALAGLMAIVGTVAGPAAAYMPELFATRHRYTGAGIGYNLAGVLGGAVPLLLAPPLAARFGGIGVGMFLAVLGLLSVTCVLGLAGSDERSRAPLDGPGIVAPRCPSASVALGRRRGPC